MSAIKKHIVFRIFTILLVASLLVPTLVKLTHFFEHHKHVICKGETSTHIHKVDLDCDFHKFQLNKNFTLNNSNLKLFLPQEKTLEIVSQYSYLSKYQRLHFSLRGPPALI